MGCCLGTQDTRIVTRSIFLPLDRGRGQEPGESHACERGQTMDIRVENPTFHLGLGSENRVYLFPGQRG